MTATADPTPPGTEAGRVSRALDPVGRRLDDLERLAQDAYGEHQIDRCAHDLAVQYCKAARGVLPLITGWGSVRASLLEAADEGVAAIARFSRIPTTSDVLAVDVSAVLVGILAPLVQYAEDVAQSVADEDTSQLLEIKRRVGARFGAGFRPALGIGDPAREPDPDPEPEPTPDPGPSWFTRLLAAIDPNTVLLLLFVAAMLTVAAVWKA